MKKFAFLFTCLLTLMVQCSTAQAEEWSTTIKEKVKITAHKFPDQVHDALDFAAFPSKIKDAPVLVVMVRNGHHKMGASSIGIKYLDTATTIQVGRVQIAKPLSLILGKANGTHLFDTFTEGGNTYQIFYTVTGGKLSPKITISTTEAKQ